MFSRSQKRIYRCQGQPFFFLIVSIFLSTCRMGNGNPLHCSCLENPRDRGAWWAALYGVTQSRTRVKRLSSLCRMGRVPADSLSLYQKRQRKGLFRLKFTGETISWRFSYHLGCFLTQIDILLILRGVVVKSA